jgi:hypothetical protein
MGMGIARDNRRRMTGALADDFQRNSGIHASAAPGVAEIMNAVALRDARLLAQFFEEADRPGQLSLSRSPGNT